MTEGCEKSAQGTTDHCSGHGGGKRCITEGCTKSAQGKTDHCIAHGGGPRCEHPDHVVCAIEPVPPSAGYWANGMRLCHQHFYLDPLNTCKAIRREVVLLGSVMTGMMRSMEMDDALVGHDFVVKSCQLIRRPDMLFKFKEFVLLIECDEHGHTDRSLASEMSHLEVIKQWVSEDTRSVEDLSGAHQP